MVRWVIVWTIASTACVRDDLVTCGDQLCPAGSLCDSFSGTCADPSGLSVPPGEIDLQVSCGGTSMSTLPFRNVSNDTINVSIASTISGVLPVPPSATLEPGDELDVQLMATAPAESIPGVPASGNLLVAVDVDQLLGRPLQLTTNGAVLTTPQGTLDFGESAIPATPIVRTFSVVNSGNVDGTLVLEAPASPYSLTSSAAVELPAGTIQTVGIAFQPLDGSFDSSLALHFTNNTCQPPPDSIALSGVGTGDAILVDHLVLDFGTATCGAFASALPLTFTNDDAMAQPLSFSISGPDAGLFTAGTAPSLDVGPSMATVMVTRAQVSQIATPGMATATLSVSAPALSSPTTIALNQLISGPALMVPSTPINFGMPPLGVVVQQSFQIVNNGNAVANVSITPSFQIFDGATTISISPSSLQIPAGGMATATVSLSTGNMFLGPMSFQYDITAVGSCNGSQSVMTTFGVQ